MLFNYKLFIFIEKESKKVKSKNLKIQCTKPNFLSTRHISPEPEAGCQGPGAAMDSFNETQGDTGLREAIKEKKGA